jgi:hypothetical protein
MLPVGIPVKTSDNPNGNVGLIGQLAFGIKWIGGL